MNFDTLSPEQKKIIARHLANSPAERKRLQLELYERDFISFVEAGWSIIEPGVPYSHNWHLDYLVEELIAMYGTVLKPLFPDADWDTIEANNKRRLVINVPTRSMKTLLVSIFFPCWLIIHAPTMKIATVSYAEDLATEINNKRRTLISSEWYQEFFGDKIKIDQGSNRKDEIAFTSKGMMYSVSVGGVFTGKGADLIILDDPQKPGEMGTPSQRQRAVDFFKDTLPTRLNNRNTGVIIVIQQRLHFQDLTGYIQETMEDTYDYLKIPLEFEEDQVFVGKVSRRKWHMSAGDVLWADRMSNTEVQKLKRELGSQNFAAQQQQDPTPDGGSIIGSVDWFKTYMGSPREFMLKMQQFEPERYNRMHITISWDMNYAKPEAKKDSDYIGVSIAAVDTTDEKMYLLYAGKMKLAFTQTLLKVVELKEQYSEFGLPIRIVIEKKANGGPIIQILDEKVGGIIPFDPGMDDKVARLKSVAGYIESGDVYIPEKGEKAEWKEKFLSDITKFPYLQHDDLVDSFSQLMIDSFVGKRKNRRSSFAVFR